MADLAHISKEDFYRTAATIRALEERLLLLFSEGKLSGTTHTYLGQEGLAAAMAPLLGAEDVVFSSHRCHGHYVMYGGPLAGLLGEVMGRACGVSGGRGGSQHLHYKRFFSSGIQGGIVGNATGAGLALQAQGSEGIAIVFLGDGTLGEGLVYESWNFAQLRGLPVLYVIENNRVAQSTPVEQALSGEMLARARAFGMACAEVESNDAVTLHEELGKAVARVRSGAGPFVQVVHTFRMGPHSKGDDTRTEAELAPWRSHDPLALLAERLDANTLARLDAEVLDAVEEAVHVAEASAPAVLPVVAETGSLSPTPWATSEETVAKALNRGLHSAMADCNEVVLIGEDLLDPYGGAFKVSKGLSTAYPGRVYSTPISEAGIVSWCVGAALLGMKPVAEIMFGDFVALAADQIINHAAKYGWVSGGAANAGVVIRTPMGGRRGYGPTHSQSLEKHFLGVAGLRVVAVNPLVDAGELLQRAIAEPGPVLFIENKVMYAQPQRVWMDGRIGLFHAAGTEDAYPMVSLRLAAGSADVVIVTYGGMVGEAMAAAERLMMEEEWLVQVVAVTQLSPLPLDELLRVLPQARVLVTAEEAGADFGWGAEVIAVLAQHAPRRYERMVRVGAAAGHIPAARHLEAVELPGADALVETIKRSMA
jgi:2-oxoisovalerate dehydrogenase E1 component